MGGPRYRFDRPARLRCAHGADIEVRLAVADGPWARFMGLMGLTGIPEGRGLLLEPCGSIHMMFMRFPIDVIWLGREARDGSRPVLGVTRGVRPWRLAFGPPGARGCIEMTAGGPCMDPTSLVM